MTTIPVGVPTPRELEGIWGMLLPVVVTEGAVSPREPSAPIEMVVRGEIIRRVRGGFGAALLRQVVTVLRGRPEISSPS